jgi:hypothetical protein
MPRLLVLALLALTTLPSVADAASVRVRPGLWLATASAGHFALPVHLPTDRPGVAIVPSAEWKPLAACLLAHQAAPVASDTEAATVRCARVQVLALEQARREGRLLSDTGTRWVQWHRKGELADVVRTALASEVTLVD